MHPGPPCIDPLRKTHTPYSVFYACQRHGSVAFPLFARDPGPDLGDAAVAWKTATLAKTEARLSKGAVILSGVEGLDALSLYEVGEPTLYQRRPLRNGLRGSAYPKSVTSVRVEMHFNRNPGVFQCNVVCK